MKKLYPLITLLLSFITSSTIHAQDSLNKYFLPNTTVTSGATLSEYLSPIVQNLPIFTGLAAFVVAILAGIKYISAADNEKEVKNASAMINYALIGLVLSVTAYAITKLIFFVGGGSGLF